MDMKPGYKQTEVGVIPADWETILVGDLFEFKNGLNKAKEYFGYGTPIVNYMDVFRSPALRASNIKGAVDVSTRELSAYDVRQGDVFFTRTSETVNEIGIASVMLDDAEKTVFSGFVLRARQKNDCLDDKFKVYCFSPRYFRQQVVARASYTTRALTNGRSLSAVILVVPPKNEQSPIAAALGDVDALLSSLDELIAKQRGIKAAAMQQLLTGKTRLPGFGGEWDTKLLGDVADVRTGPFGSALHERDYVLDGTPIITVEHLGERGVEHANLPMVSDADRKRLSAYSLEVGDIVFSRVGSVDRNALIREAESGWLFSGRLLRVRPNRMYIYPGFLSYQFHSERFKADVLSVAVGQTMASLNTKILNALSVHLPSIEEQTAIAEVLGDMDAQLAALEHQREKTALLKRGMMQELLTGKARFV